MIDEVRGGGGPLYLSGEEAGCYPTGNALEQLQGLMSERQ